jgi:UDP-N-acetylmuramate--alanine ligase
VVYVLDIYAASETPIEGITGQALAARIREFGHRCVHYTGTISQTVDAVLEKVREQDAVLTLGAGNVWQAGDRILEKLREVV